MLTQLFIVIALTGMLIVAIFPLASPGYRQSLLGKLLSLSSLTVAFYGFIQQFGIEFGLTYGLAAVYAVAMLRVVSNITIKQKKLQKNSATRTRPVKSASQASMGYKLLRFFAAGPVSGVLAVFVCMTFCQSIVMVQADQWVLAAFLYPLFWVLLAFISCYYQRRKVNLFVLAGKR